MNARPHQSTIEAQSAMDERYSKNVVHNHSGAFMLDMRPSENMDSEDPREWQLASHFANTLGSPSL